MTRRIHLPDGTTAGEKTTTQAPVAWVKDQAGNDVPLPGTYMAAISPDAAKQFFLLSKAAAAEGFREFLLSVCQLLVSALTPAAPKEQAATDDEPPPEEEKTDEATG